MSTQPIVVWTEIPVKDLDASAAFYDAVFGYSTKVDRSGPEPMAVLNGAMEGVGANLFEGEAKTGNVVHFAVPDNCEAAAERLAKAGGTVLGEPVQIPVGRFVMALDPDGNQIGLFQAAA